MKKIITYIINLFKASKTFSIIVACSTALIVTASVGTAVLLGEEKQPVNAAQTPTTEATSSTTNKDVVEITEDITDTSTEKTTETTTKKSSPTTSTTKKVETSTKKYSGSPYSTYVKPNASLTWEQAYHDNGDGTFTLTFVDGEVKTYAPHLVNEGEYVVYDDFYDKSEGKIGFTLDGVRDLWEMQWCDDCGRLTEDYGTGKDFCTQYVVDTYCHHCGQWVTKFTCHVCPNPCPHCGRKITANHWRIAEQGIPNCMHCDEDVPNSCHICNG